MTVKVVLHAEIPDEDVETFLRSVRAFDLVHPGSDFRVMCDGGSQTVDEITAMLERVGIPLRFVGRKQ